MWASQLLSPFHLRFQCCHQNLPRFSHHHRLFCLLQLLFKRNPLMNQYQHRPPNLPGFGASETSLSRLPSENNHWKTEGSTKSRTADSSASSISQGIVCCYIGMRSIGSAMRKMKVSKSGLQLQLYTMLYDSNTTVPSNPRYCYSLLSNSLLNLQKGQNSRLIN